MYAHGAFDNLVPRVLSHPQERERILLRNEVVYLTVGELRQVSFVMLLSNVSDENCRHNNFSYGLLSI